MSEKKKLSKFGKVWIIVCVAAAVLGLLVVFVGPIASDMDYYKYHEHDGWCYDGDVMTSDCVYYYYDDAFSYAMFDRDGLSICIVFALGALALANMVMLIIHAARKAKAADSQDEQAAPVSIPMGEGEQTVLERRYPAAFPIVMMVLGVLGALIGLVALMDGDDELGPVALILGLVFVIVGFILSKVLKIHLVVTTKRVYLKAPFAARLNLPLRRISAVGTGLFHYLTITSAAGFAGQIRLWFVPKYLEVYDTINALLNDIE